MFDYVSNKWEQGDWPVKEVDHIYVSKANMARQFRTYHNTGPFVGHTDWTLQDGAFRQLIGMNFHDSWLPLPSASIRSQHARAAVKGMTVQFPREISMANTLIELKEIPQLIGHIREIMDLLRTLRKNWREIDIRNVASIHAGHNFGVSPLIGDLIAIDSLWKVVDARLQHLRRTKNRWTRTGHLTESQLDPNTVIATYGSSIPGEGIRLVHKTTNCVIRSTALVRNKFDWVDTWEGIVRGLIGAMGLNNPLSIAWEMVPFSWAVDYVVPVGDWLETLQFQQITDWSIKRLTTSYKQTATIAIELTSNGNKYVPIGSYDITRYTRYVGLPPVLGGITSPNAKQLSLLAAVATGRS
jgi:hypothetical protein